MLLRPLAQTSFTFPDRSFCAATDGGQVAVRVRSGCLRILDSQLKRRSDLKLGIGVSWTASGDARLVAMWGKKLTIATSAGQVFARVALPEGHDRFCLAPDGETVWGTRHLPDDQFQLEVRSAATGAVVRQGIFPEPAPPAGFIPGMHPEGRILALWAGCGQDWYGTYWAFDNGRELLLHRVAELDFTTPAVFHPAGKEFLVVQGECNEELRRYSFPECKLLGAMPWSDPDEDHQIGSSMEYVSDKHALLNSNRNRLFLVDLKRMRITEELILEGHEPRPIRELYPILKGEESLSADLGDFSVFGPGKLLTTHEHLPNRPKQYTLVLWEAPSSFGQFTPLSEGTRSTRRLLSLRGWN